MENEAVVVPTMTKYSSTLNPSLLRQYQRQRRRKEGASWLKVNHWLWKTKPEPPPPKRSKKTRQNYRSLVLATLFVLALYVAIGRWFQQSVEQASHQKKAKNHPKHMSPRVVVSTLQHTIPNDNSQRHRHTLPPTSQLPTPSPVQNRFSTPEESASVATTPKLKQPTTNQQTDPSLDSSIAPQWMSAYIKRHRAAVRTSTDGRGRITHVFDSNNYKYLQWTCRGKCGGLGDRMFGILQTFSMAVCTNRIFLIDWHDLEEYLVPNKIPWYLPPNALPGPDATVDAMDDRSNSLLSNPFLLNVTQNIAIQTNLWMNNVPSSCSIPNDGKVFLKTAFESLFDVSTNVQAMAARLMESAHLIEPYIGIHIRSGNRERHTFHPANTWQQFVDCGNRLKTTCHGGSLNFSNAYLATDDNAIKETLLRNNSHVLTTVSDINLFHFDERESVEAWAEWLLLKNARCLVQSHSKYSALAAALSEYDDCTVPFDKCSTENCVIAT